MLNKLGFNFKNLAILIFIIAIAGIRIILSTYDADNAMSTFTPIAAIALFGGAYFSQMKSFFVPLGILWLPDIILNKLVFYGEWILFYDGFLWVYGAFALMVLVGRYFQPNKSVERFIGSALVITLIHWLVTDIGVWLSNTIYPMTPEGLWLCLVAAIPYELNLLASTLLYGGIMFGAFEWWKKHSTQLNLAFQEG